MSTLDPVKPGKPHALPDPAPVIPAFVADDGCRPWLGDRAVAAGTACQAK